MDFKVTYPAPSLTKAAVSAKGIRDAAKFVIPRMTTGLGTASIYDQIAYDLPKSKEDWKDVGSHKARWLNFLFNTGLGATGHHFMRQGGGQGAMGAGLITGAPIKDLALTAQGTMKKYEDLMKAQKAGITDQSSALVDQQASMSGRNKMIGAALAAGIPLAAIAALRSRTNKTTIKMPEDKGRVRLTLPTRNPNDVETQVEMPIDAAGLSNKALWGINRDIRRKMTNETKERTRHHRATKKDPETDTMIPFPEYQEKYGSYKGPEELRARVEELVKFAGVFSNIHQSIAGKLRSVHLRDS